MDTSVSALVKQFLSEFAAGESKFERLKKMERAFARPDRDLSRRRPLAAPRGPRAQAMTRRFIDTAVLLYSISQDRAEAGKHERAVALLEEDDLALSVQVLQEFYVEATRADRPDALPADVAADLIRTWMRFPVQEMTARVHEAALEIEAEHGLAYWDSTIVAAAQALGCQELHSEDLRHGQRVGGVAIVNPFR